MNKTGKYWADFLGLKVLTFNGFGSEEKFNKERMDRVTFLNRATSCKIEVETPPNRRDINKLKKKLTVD